MLSFLLLMTSLAALVSADNADPNVSAKPSPFIIQAVAYKPGTEFKPDRLGYTFEELAKEDGYAFTFCGNAIKGKGVGLHINAFHVSLHD